jgi:hypothetical protein
MNISTDEEIESLNLQNIDSSSSTARKNILENIAAAAGMPAKLVNSETLAVAFAEGEEDAKAIARYIDKLRESMTQLYTFFNRIVQHRAWNLEFYETVQNDFEDYKKKSYNQAFTEWSNHFIAVWPSLLTEPDSEKIKVANVKLRSIISMLELVLPLADPDNKAVLYEWAADNFNDLKILFPTPLDLDYKKLANFKPDPMDMAAAGGKPPSFKMGALGKGAAPKIDSLDAAVVDYLEEVESRKSRQRLPAQQTTEAQ